MSFSFFFDRLNRLRKFTRGGIGSKRFEYQIKTRSTTRIRRACISNFGLNRFDSSFERIRFAFAFAPRKQDLSRRRIFKNFPPRLYRVFVRFFSLSKLNHSFFFFFIFVCYYDDDNSSIASCYQCRKDLYFIFLCSDAFTNIL